MSRNNLINENNKKLFESRLQMRTKDKSKRSQISFEYKACNDSISLLNNSQPFAKVIFNKQWKKQNSTLENSINNINNSITNKRIIKINKRNKQNNINFNLSQNKSNLLIKDITFFHLKKSPKGNEIQNKTLINLNKPSIKVINNNNKYLIKNKNKAKMNRIGTITLNIKKAKKNNSRKFNIINSITRSMTTINESNKNITINNSNYIMNNTNININNINGENNKMIIKEKIIPKFRLSNNDTYVKISNIPYKTNTNNKNKRNNFVNRNNSSSNKIFDRHNSFLNNKKEKTQKIKIGKKQILNKTNFNKCLNEAIFGPNLSQRWRNSINLFPNNINNNINKQTINICPGYTQRGLFLNKYLGKLLEKRNKENKFSINNSRKKNQNTTINTEYEKGYNSNRNFNNMYLSKRVSKEKDKNISRNTNNILAKNNTTNNKVMSVTKAFKTYNEQIKQNLINPNLYYEEFDFDENFYSIANGNNQYKDIDKTEQIIEDNINAGSTKTNDEFFSEEKTNKANNTSIVEDSGILSMNEVQDIIYYNDMSDLNKEDDYLFRFNDYKNFVEKNKKKISNMFFDSNNHIKENYILDKVKIRKNFHFFRANNKELQIKNYIDSKIMSHNNSTKKNK
jgi:hypothetical protein